MERTGQQGKTTKRESEDDLEITEVREAKRQCRLQYGLVDIPRNDAHQFWEEERQQHFYVFCPSDHTNLKRALKHNFAKYVMYGMHGNRVVEALVPDDGSPIPWSIPKVTVEFKSIDYRSLDQPYTAIASRDEGLPVEPGRLPNVKQMSAKEYEEAVRRGRKRWSILCIVPFADPSISGDPRAAPWQRYTYEHCLERNVGWLRYSKR